MVRDIEHSRIKEQATVAIYTIVPEFRFAEIDAMRRSSWSILRLRSRPGEKALGLLRAGPLTVPVVLGRAGVRADKREGDGATPRGRFRPVRLWWRADRLPRPHTLLPVRRITSDVAWCEDPADRRYNRPFRRSANEPGDLLRRDDHLYDVIVELDHNTRPRAAGRGSAVFLHIARPDRSPTAGCVAFSAGDLRRLLGRLGPKTRIEIQF
jgi:L,D-peptidoglycan transpeptidase YkuD (ErfK/YbiS/YcfS/YnhG family)